jgi:hypothetical protein
MKKLILAAAFGLLVCAPVVSAQAGWLNQNKTLCSSIMEIPATPGKSTVANCFAHENGIDVEILADLEGLTSEEVQQWADDACGTILKSIVENVQPRTFTLNLAFVRGPVHPAVTRRTRRAGAAS